MSTNVNPPVRLASVPPNVLESIAFNLCSLHDFDVAFVRENERFATAVITEYLLALSKAPAPESVAAPFDRDALIALIMEETTDDIVADGWNRLGKPNVLVQGCRYIRRNTPPSPEGYANPEASAKQFAGFIADRVLKAHAAREEAPAGHVSDARQMVGAPAKAGAWIKRALRFIDLCDADAADYQDREMHEDAADLTREGFALFDMGEDACIADLKHVALRAQPQAREEAEPVAATVICTEALTPRQIDAMHDAFNRVLAGEHDGDIPIEVYERAYEKICAAGRRLILTEKEEAPPAPEAEKLLEALKHYACSCEPGHCAMSADDTDVPVDDQMCGRRAADALAAVQARDPA